MKVEIVEKYIEEILGNRLEKFEIEERYIQKIKENVQKQIYSLLYHWNDEEFRKAILIIGMEEGFFYEPEADIDVKNFVVVTIRNSYIEDIFSDECQSMGLEKPIPEDLIKVITKEAIEYFKEIDFIEISKCVNELEIDDIYGDIIKQFPLAWEALIQLSRCTNKKIIYKRKMIEEKIMTKKFNNMYGKLEISEKKMLKELQSGMSEEFSQELITLLKDLTQKEGNVFYADCFKMITRNFKKLLFIIQILLENNEILLTSNYLITDSYIGKRMQILRAAHTTEELVEKMKNSEFLCGLSKTHKEVLESYVKNIL